MAITQAMVTMGASALFSSVMTIWSKAIDAKERYHAMALGKAEAQAQIYEAVRKYDTKGIQWTRRIIALMVVFFAVAWPLIVPLISDIGVTVMWNELSGGFWFFKEPKVTMHSQTFTDSAVVYTPMLQQTMSAIIGFFFGNQIAK